jgi:hypothetical protein
MASGDALRGNHSERNAALQSKTEVWLGGIIA